MTAIDQQSTQQELPVGTWKLDPVHSSAGFAIKHMVVSTFRGRFEAFDATLDVSADGAAELAGTVDPRSIVVKDENLAAHLQAPDFFDTERYPELRFESSSIRIEGDDAVLEGELTIKGDTNPITARGAYLGSHEDMYGNTRMGLSLETVIDRTRYGLNWNAPLPKGGFALANEVTLIVDLELIRA
jgi:polyisoprenoid-binding protein YceI